MRREISCSVEGTVQFVTERGYGPCVWFTLCRQSIKPFRAELQTCKQRPFTHCPVSSVLNHITVFTAELAMYYCK